MKRAICLLIPILFLAACATAPIDISQAKKVPDERYLAFKPIPPKSPNIIVVRDEGFMGGGCYWAVHIEGKLAARFDVGEYAEFYVEPGERLLKVGYDPQGQGLCSKAGRDLGAVIGVQRETVIRAGEVKRFRLLMDMTGMYDIQRAEHY